VLSSTGASVDPSPVSGTIEEVLVDEGTVAVVGDTIVKIDAPDAEFQQLICRFELQLIHHLLQLYLQL
jgi:multidrug efflux pump subunit AcrA (membrane-fusion protein)